MANVTTYTRDGVTDCRQLIDFIVKDLTGQGTPVAPESAAEHMKLIYPASGVDPTLTDMIVILESTTQMDPFARADPTVEDLSKDPWRIAFHSSQWTGRSSVSKTSIGGWTSPSIDPVAVNSLAVYVGTPATLYIDENGEPVIGWTSSSIQKAPYYLGYPETTGSYSSMADEWKYKTTYRGKDLVEPVGNTGAVWTNTFDPVTNSTKFRVPLAATTPAPPTKYQSPAAWDGPDVTDPNQLFVNKYLTAGATGSFAGFKADSNYSQPISYRIVLTDHGLFLGVWGPDPEESGKGFNWLLVQRPVDKKLGIVRGLPEDLANPGNRPLFCVNSVNGQYWKFVVREHDNAVPSSRRDATKNTPDSAAVINPYQQQSLTENGEYVITFLNNLNSSRFKYADELDMVGTVSSDVVGGGSDIEVNVYSEENRRAYHALWSSGSFGTKMRIMVVRDIPNPNAPPTV